MGTTLSTNERVALITDFAGIEITTYNSKTELYESLIIQLFNELRRELNPEGALQIISDINRRQRAYLASEWEVDLNRIEI